MKVIKRNGSEAEFDVSKIETALQKALDSVGETGQAWLMADDVRRECEARNRPIGVEEIQDMAEDVLLLSRHFKAARSFIRYRERHAIARSDVDDRILSLIERSNEDVKQENSNKNPMINSVQRDYMAGEISRHLTEKYFLPDDIMQAHKDGLIHFHDSDYFAQHMHNCCLVNLEDMLQNGTVISGTKIDTPHSFSTACNIATQIIAQVASSQYGGQTITLSHLAPFVDVSRKKIRADVSEELEGLCEKDGGPIRPETIDRITEQRVNEEIERGVQTLQYQIITLMTTNGQAPFVSVNMYLNEVPEGQLRDDLALVILKVLDQRIQGVKNESGAWITPAFPKLLYVLQEDNIDPEGRYYYLTRRAALCTAKRMVPDYISEKMMKRLKIDANGDGQCYPCMGCRSFLTPYVDAAGKPKYYGRFNQGVVTVNLADAACSSEGNEEAFWKILDERLDLCYRALMIRHRRLLGTPSDAAPIIWQNGALARLKPGEVIDPLLFGGYSTISLGYAGLSECVWRMKGESHTQPEGMKFGLRIMQHLVDKTQEWKRKENIDFSLYGTPIESTTYKFARCLQRRFGIIPHVSDKSYITNSYHVHVTEEIDAFSKLSLEAKFQALSPGGAISYVEVPNLQNNLTAVLAVIRHIYENIIYAELNTKSDYCQACGYDGEIKIVEDGGKLVWECPKCGNRDQSKMNVARRTCGYIGSNFFNQGRTQEIKERVLHL